MVRTTMTPFRIKMVEPIKITTAEERINALKEAHYNVFSLPAELCYIDLLTDSGACAMSTNQWAAMITADESYAGSRSWFHFENTIKTITKKQHIFPVHQGRAAENLLMQSRVKPNDVIPSNCHFDTTRANIEFVGAKAIDLVINDGLDPHKEIPFKGNMDVQQLEQCIQQYGKERIPFCMLTITNNNNGGQPVSMENIKAIKNTLKQYDIPLVIDACRFAENAYFIREREPGYADKSLLEIAQMMFSYADAAMMSCKKDGLVNIGGFFTCDSEIWAEDYCNLLILREGFRTYGGLASRDLNAIAVGLMESLNYDYQKYHHQMIHYAADRLSAAGIPLVKPFGGHAIFLNASEFLSHLRRDQLPALALVNALYLEGGIRTTAMGYTQNDCKKCVSAELTRLCFPQRAYMQNHLDYVIEIILILWEKRAQLPAYRVALQHGKLLQYFRCEYEPIP
ncbi:MAG: tyrosine phenol-lyase [Gammaproteobacteria bacterium GWE2_42_36]|nr:MAG: tyrosine phenol-lyase [Gammaproteobacteria bacterium GWE2_42_36]HCU05548.1 tyrosine phenol-lyase [Coxiellaceae bacterium]